jgi:hypothetical protein
MPLEPHPTPDQVRAHGASVLPHSQSDERETLTLTQNVTINLEVAERETSPRVIRILILILIFHLQTREPSHLGLLSPQDVKVKEKKKTPREVTLDQKSENWKREHEAVVRISSMKFIAQMASGLVGGSRQLPCSTPPR